MLMQSVDKHFHINLTLVGKARAYPCHKPQPKAKLAMFASVKHSSLFSQREQYADKKSVTVLGPVFTMVDKLIICLKFHQFVIASLSENKSRIGYA